MRRSLLRPGCERPRCGPTAVNSPPGFQRVRRLAPGGSWVRLPREDRPESLKVASDEEPKHRQQDVRVQHQDAGQHHPQHKINPAGQILKPLPPRVGVGGGRLRGFACPKIRHVKELEANPQGLRPHPKPPFAVRSMVRMQFARRGHTRGNTGLRRPAQRRGLRMTRFWLGR